LPPEIPIDSELPIESDVRVSWRISADPLRRPAPAETKQADADPALLAEGLIGPDGAPLDASDLRSQELLTDIRDLSGELLLVLHRSPEQIRNLSARRFEEVLAELFDSRGYEVHLTSTTRDGGYDLCVASRTDLGSALYLVEAKRWRRPVGVPVVRGLYGVVERSRASAGIVITTSDFTRDARGFADDVRFRMSLRNYDSLCKWLSEYRRSV
jgi:restriction system protein